MIQLVGSGEPTYDRLSRVDPDVASSKRMFVPDMEDK